MPEDSQDIQRLTSLLVEDQISEAELRELNELLAGNSGLISQYVDSREIDIAIRLQAITRSGASQALIVAALPVVNVDSSSTDEKSDPTASAGQHLVAAIRIVFWRLRSAPLAIQILAVVITLIVGILIGLYIL